MTGSPLLPATCLGCGCTCDDIAVRVEGGRIVEAQQACPLGLEWFGDGIVPGRVLVEDRAATPEEGLAAAARLLTSSHRALVYLAPDLSCEAQREATALADLLRASLDSVTSSTTLRGLLTGQERGRATATLGEVRNRADVVVFWGVDPSRRYPRYASRYAPEPVGLYLPDGRRSRTVIAVDIGGARAPGDADHRLEVPPASEVATLTELAARLATIHPDERLGPLDPAGPQVTGTTAAATATTATATDDAVAGEAAHAAEEARDPEARAESVSASAGPDSAAALAATLLHWMLGGRYVVIVADAEGDITFDPQRSGALTAAAQALNGPRRGALSLLRPGGNTCGADAVLTWQTGFPVAVDFTRGAPRYRPHDGSAMARLQAGAVDVLLIIGSVDGVPAALREWMAPVPSVVIGPRATEARLPGALVRIDTAVAGVHEAGLAIRMDEVPLPLHRLLDGPPAAAATVRALRERLVPVSSFVRAGG